MTDTVLPKATYEQQRERFQKELNSHLKTRRQIGWTRLLVFLATILLAYNLFSAAGLIGLLPTVIGIGALLYLVSKDVANNEKIRNTQTLIQLNEEELQVLDHRFTNREDGHQFLPGEHLYANDLDLFGPASIYQWLSRCYTEQGRQLLAENLLQPVSLPTVLLRQEAMKELAPKLDWRQQWQAFAMQTILTKKTAQKIENWLAEEEKHFTNKAWKSVVMAYRIVTLGTAVAAIIGYIPGAAFSTLFLLYLIFSLLLSINTAKAYFLLNGIVKETGTLQSLIRWFENESFASAHLQSLQNGLRGNNESAGEAISSLKKILDRFDLRTSIFGFIFLNPFLLWDVQQMIALNDWRKQHKSKVKVWFATVAELELLHSISTLHFNQPSWCLPVFVPEFFTLRATAVGHPLILEKQRVDNDFYVHGLAKIELITGSNMAGKSTFLRSLGVNIVLAQIGAPICASEFLLSPVQVVSSMRIADNLAENTSTFYAELKKLRTIIGMVKSHQPVFILLDEILRGTNSFDRHKGAAALMKQLIKEQAVAVIATHDVELAELEKDYPQSVTNYHFDVKTEGEELYFDYKLKTGVCQSLNASLLMKKIGIDLE